MQSTENTGASNITSPDTRLSESPRGSHMTKNAEQQLESLRRKLQNDERDVDQANRDALLEFSDELFLIPSQVGTQGISNCSGITCVWPNMPGVRWMH